MRGGKCHRGRFSSESGFSLLELVVTLVVAGVLLGVAVPSYLNLSRQNRSSNESNNFLSLLTLARSEAVKRNGRVVLCKTQDGNSCSAGGSTGWETGVLVYFEASTPPNGFTAGTDTIIRAEVPFSPNASITGNTNVADSITFLGSGRVAEVGTLTLKRTEDQKYWRRIKLSNVKGPRICSPTQDSTCTGTDS